MAASGARSRSTSAHSESDHSETNNTKKQQRHHQHHNQQQHQPSAQTSHFVRKLNMMKSSSFDNTGLLNKLAVCLAIVNQMGRTRAIAQLWRDFLLELRYRYDSSIPIPDLASSVHPVHAASAGMAAHAFQLSPRVAAAAASSAHLDALLSSSALNAKPDLSRCLLHQKLQMVNCCIKKKLERQAYEMATPAPAPSATDAVSFKLSSSPSPQLTLQTASVASKDKQERTDDETQHDDDDQFFDCEDDEASPKQRSPPQPAPPQVAEGRLKMLHGKFLLNKPDEPIYVPITQVLLHIYTLNWWSDKHFEFFWGWNKSNLKLILKFCPDFV